MNAYDLRNPQPSSVSEVLRNMADRVDAGELQIDRIALYGSTNGFASQRFELIVAGRSQPPQAGGLLT